MRHRKKLGLLVLLCVVLALLPVQRARAAGTALLQAVSDHGSCGDNLSWTLNDGTLTIRGTGNMGGWRNKPPWYQSASDITSIVISNGVINIAAYAFYGCKNVSSVSIPDGVIMIGDHAFFGCTGLTSIYIPGSVTSVGGLAFIMCKNLEDIWFGGTEAQWGKISFGTGNDPLKSAAKNYNSRNPVSATYTVSFNPCGGTIDTSFKTVTEEETYGQLPTPVRKGYSFDGWFTQTTGGTQITAKSIVSLSGNQTLYAHWSNDEVIYTVTFDSSGGSVSSYRMTVVQGKTIGELPVPVREGYAFQGWFAPNGTQITAQSVITEDVTVTAHWKKESTAYFDAKKSAWSFGNTAKDFGYTSRGPGRDYPIPFSSFSYIFGDSVAAKSKYRQTTQKEWNGNCAGMSGTASLLYDGGSITTADFGRQDTYSIALADKYGELSAKTFIEAMQFAQYTEAFSRDMTRNRRETSQLNKGEKNLDALFETVAEASAQGQTTMIAVLQAGTGGHALLAYGVELSGSTEGRLSIYDCNYPGQARTLTLRKNSAGHFTGWSYDMGGYGVWGTDPGSGQCSISYIPGETIASIWDNRGQPIPTYEMLTVNAENLTILSIQHGEVAQLVNGQLVTERTDIYEVPELSMYWPEERSYYLPKDLYTISTTDDITLSASMADQGLCATVSTTASAVSFGVDAATQTSDVTVEDASVQDTYSVSLESGADGAENVTVSGTGKGETISISNKAGSFNFANCNIESLTVNGEEQILRVTAASVENGELSVKLSMSCTGLAAVSFFRDGRFLSMASAPVSGNSVRIPLPAALPAAYEVRVTPLQADTLRPLCAPYQTQVG